MIRYVLPRQLTKEQIETFGKYLSSHSQPNEVTIKYISGDGEAERYADDISSAFRAGNWLPKMSAISPATVSCHANLSGDISCTSELQQMRILEGVYIAQTGPNPPQPSTIEEKLHPRPLLSGILREAFKTAGIQGIITGYSFNSDPLNTVTAFVGFRTRDKWGVLPPRFSEHLGLNLPQDLSDDDF
jgi:hypothetical protein